MIILRLQGLPWSATAKDVRQHFEGLSIPDGGVHIIGGEEGDVFIAFSSDDDARKAMQRQKQPLNGSRIMLLLSSKSEMQEVIAESRAATQKPDPFGTSEIVNPPVSQTNQRGLLSREGSVTSSHSQGYQGFPQSDDQQRQPSGYGDGYQGSNVNVSNQSLPPQGYGTSYPPSQSNERLNFGQSQNKMYGNDHFNEDSLGRGDAGQRPMYQEFNTQERNQGIQRRDDFDAGRQGRTDRDSGYPQESAQFNRFSEYDRQEERLPSGNVQDQRYRSGSYGMRSDMQSLDRDMSYMQGGDKSRSLLPSGGMRNTDERGYQEEVDDPMEGISTSYPPAGPADKFDYQQTKDADQRGSSDQVKSRDSHSEITQSMYGRQNLDREQEKGKFIRTPYEDAYWATSTSSRDLPSEAMQGRRTDSFKSFQDNQGKPMTEKKDYYQSEGSNENEMRGSYFDSKQYGNTHLNQGSMYNQQDKREESFNMDQSQSAVYPMYQDYRSQSSDFDNRMGDVSNRAPLSNQEPPIPSLKADIPSRGDSDSQMYGSRGNQQQPTSTASSLLDHPAPASLYGSKLQMLEPSGDEFYAVRLTGLPYGSSERDIRLFLRDINIAPDGIQIHNDPRGNMTGTANVKLRGPSDIDQALKRHQQYMGKRYIDVRPCLQSEWEKEKEDTSRSEPSRRRSRSPVRSRKSPLRSSNTAIEMRGVAPYTKNSDIVDFFEGLAMRQDTIHFDPHKDGPGSGIVYVEFVDSDMARRACQKNGKLFNRRSVSIRIISKEIMEAKISDMKRRADEKRSDGRRSPDRRRGSSPYNRRGRSPGRRARSPVRSSSRSSPGRNGPGRRQTSPSRDRRDRDRDRDRDRESSRQSRRNQSPVRHGSQDRKSTSSEKKDRRDQESRDVRSSSKGNEDKSRGSPKTEEKDRLQKAARQDDPSKSLLPSPSLQKEKGKEQGLLKTPELSANDKPPFGLTQKNFGSVNIPQDVSTSKARPDETKEAPSIDFHAIRDAVSRFSKDSVDKQQGEDRQDPMSSKLGVPEQKQGPLEGRKDPIGSRHGGPDHERGLLESRHDVPEHMQDPMDNRYGVPEPMGMSGGMLGNNRNAPKETFPFTDERQNKGGLLDFQPGQFRGPRRGFDDNRRDGPINMQSGPAGNPFVGPRDSMQGSDLQHRPLDNMPSGPMDVDRGPFNGPRGNRQDNPMHHGQMSNTFTGARKDMRDEPMNMQPGPMGNIHDGPGDRRRDQSMDMNRGLFSNPEDIRANHPSDMHHGSFGGPGDNRRSGPIGSRWEGGIADRQGRMQESWQGGPRPNRQDEGRGETTVQSSRGRSLEEWRQDQRNRNNESMDIQEGQPGQSGERRRPLIESSGPHSHGSSERKPLLDLPEGELKGYDKDRDIDRRQQGFFDHQDKDRINERGPQGMNRRDPSPRRWTDSQSEERIPRGGIGFPNQGPGDNSQGRNGPSFRPNDRDSFPRDGRNVPSQQDGPPFPPRNNLPGLLDEIERDRREPDNQGPRDVHGHMDRQHGPEDRRSMERDMRMPGEREPHHITGPPSGSFDGPPGDGASEYVCAHVRNVPYTARWPDIAHFFSGIQIVPGGIHIMINSSGKPSGHCFVEFTDAHQARLTEERRLQKLKDRPLQINACSKSMMIRALQETGELQQNRPNHGFGGRGHGQPFGARGPHFQGNRGPVPHQDSPHGFHPRGPHPHGSFRPPFRDMMDDGRPHHLDDGRPRHPDDGLLPRQPEDGHLLPYPNDGRPLRHPDDGHPPGHPDDGGPRHPDDRHPPRHPHDGRPRHHDDGRPPRYPDDGRPPRHHDDSRPPRHVNDGRPPRHLDDGRPPRHPDDSRPRHLDEGRPPRRPDDGHPQHPGGSRPRHLDDGPPQNPRDRRPPERPQEKHEPKKLETSKESKQSEPNKKVLTPAPKTAPEPSPKKPQPEKPKETVPETKETTTSPVSTKPSPIQSDQHKGCVVTATNLPLTITVDAIGDFFKGFSTIKGAIKLDTNEATGKATGQAKIVFTTPTEANRAIKERNNRPLNGRIVRLHVM
ncbi:uncharacterized protein LOC121407474 [Lytechinus variegatus]|uniref:uncharacterized protein LOC121407474 n=1 Tax=Lytechinus variegatus TaxID=7654 RepID=UPI001BB2696A|nr:uncharacterized protein LOC121407474 [Lytechinus variegatus]